MLNFAYKDLVWLFPVCLCLLDDTLLPLPSQPIGHSQGQVLDAFSHGRTNLNDVSIAAWCCALVGLSLLWRVVHYVALKRAIS